MLTLWYIKLHRVELKWLNTCETKLSCELWIFRKKCGLFSLSYIYFLNAVLMFNLKENLEAGFREVLQSHDTSVCSIYAVLLK